MGLTARGAWEVASAGTVAVVAVVMLGLFLQDRRQAGSSAAVDAVVYAEGTWHPSWIRWRGRWGGRPDSLRGVYGGASRGLPPHRRGESPGRASGREGGAKRVDQRGALRGRAQPCRIAEEG